MAHCHMGKKLLRTDPPQGTADARAPMSSSGANISNGRACKMKDAGIRVTHYKFD